MIILLDNAMKHSKGEIWVSAKSSGMQMMICVQDFGAGIALDKQAHVFDRFYRGDDQLLSAGFGLGLPIAKALVEGQGGKIELASEPDKGTSIQLYFPVQ
jgi:signal transduction histidine kinase